MFYSHIDHYPINKVYEFAKACENGHLPHMDDIMKKFFNNIMVEYMDHQTKVLEYEYAFWFGLEKAAWANQHEAIKYIFEHPNLKMFKDNFSSSTESINQLNANFLNKPDKIFTDEISKILKVASENCNFESFELLKQLHQNNISNIGEIYMGFFKKLNLNNTYKLTSIPNFNEMVKDNTKIAVEYILEQQNIYSMRLLSNHFNIDNKYLIELVEQYKEQAKKNEIKLFCDKVILELTLPTNTKKGKINKI